MDEHITSPAVRHRPNLNELAPSTSFDSKATHVMGGWRANSSASAAKDGTAAASSSKSATVALTSVMVVIDRTVHVIIA